LLLMMPICWCCAKISLRRSPPPRRRAFLLLRSVRWRKIKPQRQKHSAGMRRLRRKTSRRSMRRGRHGNKLRISLNPQAVCVCKRRSWPRLQQACRPTGPHWLMQGCPRAKPWIRWRRHRQSSPQTLPLPQQIWPPVWPKIKPRRPPIRRNRRHPPRA